MSTKRNETDQLPLEIKGRQDAVSGAEGSPPVTGELVRQLQELEMQNGALRASLKAHEKYRDRYLGLYEFSAIGYFALTRDGVISDINLAGATMLGEERKNLIGRGFSVFVVPEDIERWNYIFTHTLHDENQRCELLLKRGDGSLFYAQLDSLLLNEEGAVPVVWLALADISGHNQIQASERRLRNILDSIHDMIFIFSPDTLRFVYANKGAVSNMGFDRKELLQITPLEFLPISEPECRAFIAPLLSGKKRTRRFEAMIKRKNGRDFPAEVQLQFVHENGVPGLFVAVVRDISNRKFAEHELRRQKKLLRKVVDMNPNMIFVKDAQGRFLLANLAIADYYGVEIQDMIGKNNSEINSNQQDVDWFQASDHEVIEHSREVIMTELLMKNGKQRWYYSVKKPLLQDDGAVNLLGIRVDITELKESGDKLAESYKELQRLALHLENYRAEERIKIARNLHDEMGATLAVLKMRLAWLKSKLPEGLPQLEVEVDHMSGLVSDGIRTMRQVVSELRPNLLDDAGLVAAVEDYIKRFERDTEIECALVLPGERIQLNEQQSVTVFRIIQESLNNVAKHSRASKVEIGFARLGDLMQLQISDNGTGFDTTRKGHSFGLLGIKERALMIGGTATIASIPGQGTRVLLSIPILPHESGKVL